MFKSPIGVIEIITQQFFFFFALKRSNIKANQHEQVTGPWSPAECPTLGVIFADHTKCLSRKSLDQSNSDAGRLCSLCSTVWAQGLHTDLDPQAPLPAPLLTCFKWVRVPAPRSCYCSPSNNARRLRWDKLLHTFRWETDGTGEEAVNLWPVGKILSTELCHFRV